MAVSTYTLAVEAYEEIQTIYDANGLTAPSDTPLAETYGSYEVSARRALRVLGYDVSNFPTTPVTIDDDDANDFRNLINYFILSRLWSGAASSATKIKVGPIEIQNSSYESLHSLLNAYTLRVASLLDLPLSGQITEVDFAMDWESEFTEPSEYSTYRGWLP